MDSLIATIEEFEPSHMVDRKYRLSEFKKEMEAEGYIVENITQKDIECYWIRVKSVEEKYVAIGYEYRYDLDIYKNLLVKA